MFKSSRMRRYGRLTLAVMLVAGSVPLAGAMLPSAGAAPSGGQGQLFYDVNFNKAQDGLENFGPSGVVVRFYGPGNVLVGTSTSDANGYFATVAGARMEVDASTLPQGLSSGGAGSTFTVATVDGGVGYAIPVWEPQRYATSDSPYAINSQSAAGSTYSSGQIYGATDSGAAAGTDRATFQQTGSVFGIAWSPKQDAVFQAAFHKRFSPYGPGGSGAIYRDGALFATVPNAGMTVTTYNGHPNYDAATGHGVTYTSTAGPGNGEDFAGQVNVGKSGLGGMDMITDVNTGVETLWVVNMSDKSIYPINAASGAVGGGVSIPNPTGATWRPMALKVHNGLIYVGGVDEVDLQARAFAYNPATGAWSAAVWQGATNVPRTDASVLANLYNYGGNVDATFRAWSDDLAGSTCNPNGFLPAPTGTAVNPYLCHSPQPMFSDIEFDSSGAMVVSIRDRFADMNSGNFSQPAIMPNGNAVIDADLNNRFGVALGHGMISVAPRVNSTQFGAQTFPFNEDVVQFGGPQLGHQQATQGAALSQPSGYSVITFADPSIPNDWDSRNAVGTRLFPAGSSTATSGLMVYGSQLNDGNPGTPAGKLNVSGFGKGGGLGDLVAATGDAPVEIGNRVWLDANANGIQDPGEPGIGGVTVNLSNGASTVTDANGQYLFSGLAPNTAYTITIPDGQTAPVAAAGGAPFGALPLTTANVDGLIDQGDSDAVGTTDFTISITTGGPGVNNHTYDFGVLGATDLSLEKFVDVGDGNGFSTANTAAGAPFINADQPFTYRIDVINESATTAPGVGVADVLPAGVTFVSATNGGTAAGQTVSWSNLTIPANSTVSLDVVVVVNNADAAVFAAGATALNAAQIVASTLPDTDSTPNNDPAPGTPKNEDDDDPAFVQMMADVSLLKSVDADATNGNAAGDFVPADSTPGPIVRAARPFTYRITVTNDGPSAARNMTVQDVLPADVVFVSATDGGTAAGQTVTWTGVNVAAGASTFVDVTVIVPHANVAAFLGNQGRVNPAQILTSPVPDIDSTPGNDTDPAAINEDDDNPANVFLPIADLEVVKRVTGVDNGVAAHGDGVRAEEQTENSNVMTVDIGSQVTWQVQVTNVGPDAATGVTITDVLPASTRFVSATTLNGAYNSATGVWTLANQIPVGGQATLQIRAILLPASIGAATADVARVVNLTSVLAANEADPDSIPGDPVVTNQDDNDDAVIDPRGAAIGDFIWNDLDGDGIQEAGEPGIAGVGVILTINDPIVNSAGVTEIPAGTVWTTSTNPDGSYVFENLPTLPAGISYTVTAMSPGSIWVASPKDAGALDGVDSDADMTTGVMSATTLTPGERDMTWDAGFYIPAELSLVKTVNGVSGVEHDATPHGAGAPVNPADACNPASGAAGGSAAGGCDLVDIDEPFTYTVTVTNAGPGDARDVQIVDTFPAGVTVTAAELTYLDTLGAPVAQDCVIGSTVVCDLDDVLAPGVTATLKLTAEINIVDGEANYMTPGFEVFARANSATVTTSTPDDATVSETTSPNTDVASAQPILFVQPSILKEVNTGRGWFDANTVPASQWFKFGVPFDYRITVENAGNLTATGMTVTDVLPASLTFVSADASQGTFDEVSGVWTIGPVDRADAQGVPGSAVLTVTAVIPTSVRGEFVTGDSRVNTATLSPAEQPLDPRKPAPDYDDPAVIIPPAAVGNLVWEDFDRDGIQDAGEPGVPGVTVKVMQDDVVVDTVVTDANGIWTTDNLAPNGAPVGADLYTVVYEAPPAYQTSPVDAGTDDGLDSDGLNPSVSLLESGEIDPTYDLGLWLPVDVQVVKDLVSPKGGAHRGDKVDWSIKVTNNGPGRVVPGAVMHEIAPIGLTDVVVVAPAGWDCVGADCTSTFLWAVGDSYEFKVSSVMGANPPADELKNVAQIDVPLVQRDVPADPFSDTNPKNNEDPAVVPVIGSIGNFVWNDIDRDGAQDPGEVGVPNVQVNLTGTTTAGTQVTQSTTTGPDGFYLFDGLPSGTYTVQVVLPVGHLVTVKDAGADDALDSDAAANGETAPIKLGSGEVNLTVDAGLYQVVDLQVVKTGVIEQKRGGKVTWEFTVTNNGPLAALPGVKVSDELPLGLKFVSMDVPAGWVCSSMPVVGVEGGSVSCESTTPMPVGSSVKFTVVSKVVDGFNAAWASAAPGAPVVEFSNTAKVASSTGQVDLEPGNNGSTGVVTLVKPPTPTGSETGQVLLVGGGLLLLGGGGLLFGRRRRRPAGVAG